MKVEIEMQVQIFFGGLGNQLFQFANLMHLIQISSDTSYISATSKISNRPFALQNLISESTFSKRIFYQNSIGEYLLGKVVSNQLKKHEKIPTQVVQKNDKELVQEFNIFGKRFEIHMGYYQTAEIVQAFEKPIFNSLQTYLDKNHPANLEKKKSNYLALHIRRGDYIRDNHGYLSLQYYLDLISKHPNLPIHIHTDDHAIGSNLKRQVGQDTKIFGPENSAWHVLSDLSQATVVISANSSLSWWGGWMAQMNGGKMVIPSIWNKMKNQSSIEIQYPGFHLENSQWE